MIVPGQLPLQVHIWNYESSIRTYKSPTPECPRRWTSQNYHDQGLCREYSSIPKAPDDVRRTYASMTDLKKYVTQQMSSLQQTISFLTGFLYFYAWEKHKLHYRRKRPVGSVQTPRPICAAQLLFFWTIMTFLTYLTQIILVYIHFTNLYHLRQIALPSIQNALHSSNQSHTEMTVLHHLQLQAPQQITST